MNQKKLSFTNVAKKILLPMIAIMTVVLVALWNGKSAEAASSETKTLFSPGGTLTYSISASNSISENVSWISVSRTSATSIRINVSENPTLDKRTGYVYIKSGNTTVRTIRIDQMGDVYFDFDNFPLYELSSGSTTNGYVIVGTSRDVEVRSSNNNWVHITVSNNQKSKYYVNGNHIGYKVPVKIVIDRNTTRRNRHADITIGYKYSEPQMAYTLYQSSHSY